MKKRLTILLALLLTLICIAASAQEYYTLPEIREQAAAGWHETYTDKYGRETTVDIDIEVFGEETVPVIKACWGKTKEYRIDGEPTRDAIIEASRKKKNGVSTYPYNAVRGMKVDHNYKYAEEYGNDLTLGEVYAFIEKLLKEQGIDQEYAWNRPYEFNVLYSAAKDKESGYPWYVPSLTMELRSQDEYSICDRSFKTQEILAEDIPLCSLDVVIQGVEVMIEKGYIQDVFSLRFGYAVYNDPTINSDKPVSAYDAQCYYLVPSWVIECGMSNSPKKDYEDYHESMIRTITINAQTGKMIDYFDTSKKGYGDADYKGFISWDDVQ